MVNVGAIPTGAAYWDWRYSNGHGSGDGSYGAPMLRKVELLSQLKGVRTIAEVGCGDFNFGKHLQEAFPGARYVGMDTSRFIVERNRKLYGRHNVLFVHGSAEIPPSDLLLCVDVLFHVMDDREQEQLLGRLAQSWTRYLALSAYEYDGYKHRHINIRKFDPARFGEPLVREVIEDDGTMYFYIWERHGG